MEARKKANAIKNLRISLIRNSLKNALCASDFQTLERLTVGLGSNSQPF